MTKETIAQMKALKPCPFCGGNKLNICKTEDDGRVAYCVSCRTIDCHGGIWALGHWEFPSESEAITAWNTRHQDKLLALAREALEFYGRARKEDYSCGTHQMVTLYGDDGEAARKALARIKALVPAAPPLSPSGGQSEPPLQPGVDAAPG